MTTETRSLYSQLPAIDRLLRDSSFLSLRDTYGHTRVVELLRQMLDEAREVIRDSQTLPAWCENWAQEVDARLTKEAQSALRPVINLTGTVLHTNLGRALQAEAAVEAVAQAMRSPVTLEYDLDDAGRGHRDRALAQLLCRITGAEDACIVNNNAAAVLLMLAATASGKEVVVYNGDLKIEIVESNGTVREFTQSAAELPVLQRKGRFRYNIALGEYRSDYKEFTKEPRFIQSSFAYGLGYNYTLYGGGIFSEDYKQSTLGLGKYFENFGAFSFDSSFSSAELDNNTVKDGQAYRVMYSKIFSPTDTAFNLAGYKYQSSGYYDFNDFQYVNNGLDFYNQKSRLSVSLSQPLGDELGAFYLSASDDKYWNNGSGYNVNISYSNYIGFVNSSLSFFINKNPSISEVDKAIFISLSIPLDRLSNSLRNNYLNTSVSGSKHSDTQRVGFSGNGLNNQLNYNIYQSFDSRNNSHSGNVDASYVGTYGRVSGGYFYQDNLERFSYGINGGVAIHDEGITLSQPLSLNGANALLKVERANGIKVQNGIGIYTDFRGYTVVPNLTSYSRNKVSIDTSSLDRNIEVSRSGSTVVPTRGALVKTIFETNIGMKVLAEIKDEKGVHIPFGSVVSIDGTEKKSGFIVDDNGVVYLTGMPNKGTLNVQWGSDNSRKCKSEFNLGEVNSTYLKKIYLTCNYNYSG